jgi:hypothetical protein
VNIWANSLHSARRNACGFSSLRGPLRSCELLKELVIDSLGLEMASIDASSEDQERSEFFHKGPPQERKHQ